MTRAIKIIGWFVGYMVMPLVLTVLSYGWGYRQGTIDMRDTMMCVMDRISGEPIGKGASGYCVRIGEVRAKRS